MSGRIVRVLLVEVPCVVLEMNGKVLGEVTTNHAKYPQMLLAANLRKLTNDSQEFEVDSRPFAKFVEAIDPSLGEMVLVGGWAHRL